MMRDARLGYVALGAGLASALCLGCAADPGDDSLTSNVTEASVVATCNDGAMVVSKLADNDWEYGAAVYDAGVVDWFVAQSQLVEELPVTGEGATTASVQKEFPWMATVVEDDEGRRLLVRDLHVYDDGARYLTSGPPGSSVEWQGDGMMLSINGGKMISSHAIVYYNVGDWLFESCEAPTSP
jgi:hypothetical protein